MPTASTTHAPRERLAWNDIKGAIRIERVAESLLGPPPGRGGRGFWWRCPFHPDRNPSFRVDPERGSWRCFGCSEHGDAAELIMRMEGRSFPDAIRRVAELCGLDVGGPSLHGSRRPSPPKPAKRAERPKPGPSGLPREDAGRAVADAAEALWRPEGRESLADLRRRGLSDATIRRARLGHVAGLAIPRRNGDGFFRASGVSIPWFDAAGALQRIKIRQADGRTPKYAEAFRDRPTIHAPIGVIPGRPLVIVEGELDAILLDQLIGDIACVITTGSASDRPTADVLAMLPTGVAWHVAHDADDAGNEAAGRWLCFPWAVRVRPPVKDWCDFHGLGFNAIRNHWRGVMKPTAPTWEELESQRWGPALEEPEADDDGAERLAERRAIAEADGCEPPRFVRSFKRVMREYLELRRT